jgi:hypothetical protein
MARQVVEHDSDQLGFGIIKIDEITHEMREVASGATTEARET